MCSGRVDLEFIFRAFANGMDGVLIGGCRLDECNYTTHGNYDALSNTHLGKQLLAHIGLNPERLRIQFMSGADGNLLAEVSTEFARTIADLGPIGAAEGFADDALRRKLIAIRKLVPYIRLVERERLRMPIKSKEKSLEFLSGDAYRHLFDELIVGKLAISQILLLLEEKPRSTGEIAEHLGLKPSEVSKHMNSSSRQGLVRYDVDTQCYALA
jgi:F420-non-reducing hydrogenase iron-sulfur subunit